MTAKKNIYTIIFFILTIILTNCSSSGGPALQAPGQDPAQNPSQNPVQDPVQSPIQNPNPDSSSSVGGTITGVVEVENDIDLESLNSLPYLSTKYLSKASGITVYLEDNSDISAETDANGVFTIFNVPAGTQCIYAYAEDQNGDTYGFRSCNIEVVDGTTADVGSATLSMTGSISGNVQLNGQADHSGIDVYIPGTSFTAKTDENGNYTIYYLPAGTYESITAETDGYLSDFIDDVVVEPASNTVVNNLVLWASTGVDGYLTINNGATTSNTRTVTLNLYYSQDATLMKISEDENFKNVSWEPVNPSETYTFDSEGTQTLYVKYTNANGLETSPFTASITIDLFGATEGSFTVTPDELYPLGSTIGDVELSLNIPENADYWMVDVDSNFSNVPEWMDLPEGGTYTYSFPDNNNSCGSKTFYVKYKDGDGYVSERHTASLEINCWVQMSSTDMPSKRYGATSIWTGNRMCIWGGNIGHTTNTGACYDPVNDSWSTITTTNAPSARAYHAAVWTGNKMCVWGGDDDGDTKLRTGGCYDPVNDSWSAITTTNAPSARAYHAAVSTGNKMCVWGGYDDGYTQLGTGGCYDSVNDSWSTITTTNAPSARAEHTAVWTGEKMCIWGGTINIYGNTTKTGGCYDPVNDSWSSITTSNAPNPRSSHGAVWTGNKMCIWGGYHHGRDELSNNPEGCYDPDNDSWSSITTSNAPEKPFSSTAVWTGEKMCVSTDYRGGCYDPKTNTWKTTPNYYWFRDYNVMPVWTGDKLCVWNGGASDYYSGSLSTGACLGFIP
ncbi:MAG: carboxypeptidase regulatory-like domain-containing protein [Deltaproteobacteria bacterium]|nr:carboxypeptidase regulatory-like domain-containing protein [Deltaproteobacteria bacterium]